LFGNPERADGERSATVSPPATFFRPQVSRQRCRPFRAVIRESQTAPLATLLTLPDSRSAWQ
jgi:hypothetical protein